MGGRLIKTAVLIFLVILLSAGTIFVSRGQKSFETVSAQVYVPLVSEPIPSPLPPAIRDFVRFMEQELDSTQTVGAAFTIVQAGRVVYTGTHGVRENGSQQEVDEHTLFRLASVSKGFAGVLASMLELDGAFSLNDRFILVFH